MKMTMTVVSIRFDSNKSINARTGEMKNVLSTCLNFLRYRTHAVVILFFIAFLALSFALTTSHSTGVMLFHLACICATYLA